MMRQRLRGIRVESKQELVDQIYKYCEEVSENPVVYHWIYKKDDITVEELAEADIDPEFRCMP